MTDTDVVVVVSVVESVDHTEAAERSLVAESATIQAADKHLPDKAKKCLMVRQKRSGPATLDELLFTVVCQHTRTLL